MRVLNLWQKNAVFKSDIIQPLLDMAAGIAPPSITPVMSCSSAPVNNATPGQSECAPIKWSHDVFDTVGKMCLPPSSRYHASCFLCVKAPRLHRLLRRTSSRVCLTGLPRSPTQTLWLQSLRSYRVHKDSRSVSMCKTDVRAETLSEPLPSPFCWRSSCGRCCSTCRALSPAAAAAAGAESPDAAAEAPAVPAAGPGRRAGGTAAGSDGPTHGRRYGQQPEPPGAEGVLVQ